MMRRFIVFSVALYCAIVVAGSLAFTFSMRQIVRDNKDNELIQLLELKRVKLETSVDNEISHAMLIADSPLIKGFFADTENPELRKFAFDEFAAYRQAFGSGTIFWISDLDKQFYFNDLDPTDLDPDNPEYYWYNMTLYTATELGYNFNINYNADLDVTNLWINAPVFDDSGKPLGIIGTGIDLTTFIDMIYADYTGSEEVFFFNSAGEITGARDVRLVAEKKSINEELISSGMDILGLAKAMDKGASLTLELPTGGIAISSIPLLEWYSVAVFSYSYADYDSAMTILFFVTLFVLLFVLVIFNIFIARLLKPMRLSMEEAEAANQAKSAFLSTMSHEIRTPLNAILGLTEIQLQKDSLDLDVRDGLEKVFASGDMLLGIINDILDLSKIESGKLELLSQAYEVAGLIGDTVQLNIMRIGSKPIEFELSTDENMPACLFGDELRIKQILNNLLSNAFKYTARGTVKMTVTSKNIEGSANEVMLVVKVSDTGQGMTKDQVDKLFDAYSRFNLDANRTTEGTGLGMSITRNLLHMMYGEIAIESIPGRGSIFTVRIPQARIGTEALGNELVQELSRFKTGGIAHLKRAQISYDPMPYGSVLVVDDVETNLFVAEGLLSPYDLNVETANSGFIAIDKIKAGSKYDIIFMDHMMPKMDGIETTKILRGLGYEHPVVALTANAVAGQADVFLSNGFNDFISKPIDIRNLNTILNKLVRDKQPPEVIEEARALAKAKRLQPQEVEEKNEINLRYAEVFVRDARKALVVLERFTGGSGPYGEEDIREYTINTHGMKSALGNIGKKDLSAIAARLEALGRDSNLEAIISETPAFVDSLRAFADELTPKEEPAGEEPAVQDFSRLSDVLLKIKAACGQYDESAAEEALAELKGVSWTQQIKDLLEKIDELLLHSEFDEIAEEIDGFMASEKASE